MESIERDAFGRDRKLAQMSSSSLANLALRGELTFEWARPLLRSVDET